MVRCCGVPREPLAGNRVKVVFGWKHLPAVVVVVVVVDAEVSRGLWSLTVMDHRRQCQLDGTRHTSLTADAVARFRASNEAVIQTDLK